MSIEETRYKLMVGTSMGSFTCPECVACGEYESALRTRCEAEELAIHISTRGVFENKTRNFSVYHPPHQIRFVEIIPTKSEEK